VSGQLSRIQAAFQHRMLSGADGLEPYLAEGGHIGVYDHAYRARLQEILAGDFPALHSLMGDEAFGQVINGYLDAHPSRRRSVRWLGAALGDWLRETAPWSAHREAADMAAFEWALGLAFDAPDAPVVAQVDLMTTAAESWPGLRFGFHPALTVISLHHDVTGFQQAVAGEREPEAAPEPLDRPASWAIWRDHDSLIAMFRRLEPDEAAMLDNARAGADFSVLCDTLSFGAEGDDAAMRAAGLVLGWVQSGWVSNLNGDTA